MQEIAKSIIILGIALIAIGAFLILAGKIPFLGRLPGDFLIQRKSFTFYTFAAKNRAIYGADEFLAAQYSAQGTPGFSPGGLHFPLVSSILVSAAFSLIFWLLSRR